MDKPYVIDEAALITYATADQMKLYPVKVNPEYYAIMQNDFIKGHQGTTSVKIAKFLRLMVSQIVKHDTDFKTHSISIKELAKFWDIEKPNIYRDVEDMCEQLVKTVVKIKRGSGKKAKWSVFHWVSRADYENGIVTFRFSDEIKPYVLGLNEWYTQYQIEEIQGLRSWYSIRLYELLKCDSGIAHDERDAYEYTIEELRDFFECNDKYRTTSIFLCRTVEQAVEELNQKTSLELRYEYNRKKTKGNPIVSVIFYPTWHRSRQFKCEVEQYHAQKSEGQTTLTFPEWRAANAMEDVSQ